MTFKEELEQILSEELIVVQKLKEISLEKTNMIMENKVEELELTIKKEESLINQMALLEEKRIKLLDTWGLNVNTPISNLIDKIGEDKRELLHIKEELTINLEELSTRNMLNNDLIQENLDWVDFNMNLITQAESPTSYGKGKDNKPGSTSIFDRKV
jgi:flagellar biosynthesis/type III secretory pathway chaperone